MLAVLDAGHDLSLRRTVALELIRDDHSWDILQALQQLAEETLGRFLISLTLHQNIKDVAILVHGSPQVMLPAIDPDEYFIEVPFITGSWSTAAQFVGICLTKLEAPFSDRLISNDDATHSHNLFDITIAESEAEVEPHCVADDLRREAMAAVERSSSVHRRIMPQGQTCCRLASLS